MRVQQRELARLQRLTAAQQKTNSTLITSNASRVVKSQSQNKDGSAGTCLLNNNNNTSFGLFQLQLPSFQGSSLKTHTPRVSLPVQAPKTPLTGPNAKTSSRRRRGAVKNSPRKEKITPVQQVVVEATEEEWSAEQWAAWTEAENYENWEGWEGWGEDENINYLSNPSDEYYGQETY